jgi:hypothetical protein
MTHAKAQPALRHESARQAGSITTEPQREKVLQYIDVARAACSAAQADSFG